MKYFTPEWWFCGCDGAEEVVAAYQSHLDQIKDQLPESASELDAGHSLHDAEIVELVEDLTKAEVQLTLDGWDIHFENEVRYVLVFTGVETFEQNPSLKERPMLELGDLGYWEWDSVSAYTELRMLFATGTEFKLVFRGFSFTVRREET